MRRAVGVASDDDRRHVDDARLGRRRSSVSYCCPPSPRRPLKWWGLSGAVEGVRRARSGGVRRVLCAAVLDPWRRLPSSCISPRVRKEGEVSIREMMETHPQPSSGDLDVRVRCIEACSECAVVCTSCADADLGESDLQELVRCIGLCLDCADVCDATRRIVIRLTASEVGVVSATVQACVLACRASREECERHAEHHEHCRICGEVCRRCEQACEDLLASLG
jgi:hypothetical protein